MRKIDTIIIHCSATPAGRPHTAADIARWHRERGFAGIGYHHVVLLDGTVEKGRPEAEIGAHCQGHNARSIGVCYIGGTDAKLRPLDTRTEAQKAALRALVSRLLERHPGAAVRGHDEFAPGRACPCFSVRDEFG